MVQIRRDLAVSQSTFTGSLFFIKSKLLKAVLRSVERHVRWLRKARESRPNGLEIQRGPSSEVQRRLDSHTYLRGLGCDSPSSSGGLQSARL